MADSNMVNVQELDAWFLRIDDVSRLTGLSRSEIRRAIDSGRLRAKRYGQRSVLIEPAEARRWIDAESRYIERIA